LPVLAQFFRDTLQDAVKGRADHEKDLVAVWSGNRHLAEPIV
jgi:hypothetical protein